MILIIPISSLITYACKEIDYIAPKNELQFYNLNFWDMIL